MRFTLILLFSLGAVMPSFSQDAPPNIVLIVADDLGWRDVGFNGGNFYHTPNLDSLAALSLVFRQAYAGASNCAPSRAVLMSGRNTPYHGIYTVGDPDRGKTAYRKLISTPNETVLADTIKTLAQQLRGAEYSCINIGKWHLGPDARSQGFQRNVAGFMAGHPKTYFSPYDLQFLADGPKGEYLTDRLTREAIQFVNENADRPFFLYLPYYAVHTPLQGKPKLTAAYSGNANIRDERQANYGAMVENLDANVGMLAQAINRLGLNENTLFIFTSDNGGIAALSPQDPLRAGKGSYYEGGIRVPAFFHWPGHVGPGVSEEPIVNLDLYPTLLALAGVRPDRPLDGVNLMPLLLRGEGLAERPLVWHFPVYLEAYQPGMDGSRDPLFRTRPGSVIRRGEWKLHQYFEDGGLELYKLSVDPGEKHDLVDAEPEIREKLLAELQAWRDANGAPVPAKSNPGYNAREERSAIEAVR